MNPSEPPAPPPDDEFSRMIGGALKEGDFSLTENRRAAVLKAFADAAQADSGAKRRVTHIGSWLTAGAAAAACVALWLAGTFSATPTPRRDEMAEDRPRTESLPQTVPGEQLERANLRLAVLSDQLSRAEHQLLWRRATAEKRQSN